MAKYLTTTIKHSFIESVPDQLEDGILYVSTTYATAIHKCCCGCGKEVVTPFSPTDWEMISNGESVSLYPSIGNWNYDCKSHYWITKGKVMIARKWSEKEINYGRTTDKIEKKKYYKKKKLVE
jgi:hypothetical protein